MRAGVRYSLISMLAVAAFALTGSFASATSIKKPPPPSKRCYRGLPCKKSSTNTTTTATTTTSKPKPVPAVNKANIYDGRYAGAESVTADWVGAQSGSALHRSTRAAIHFTVLHGVVSGISVAHPTISNGQISIVVPTPNGSIGGTVFFVLGANDAVAVHGTLSGTVVAAGAGHATGVATITAARVAR